MRGGPTSGPAAPAAIQLQEMVQSTQNMPGDSETLHTEVDTVQAPRDKLVDKLANFTSTGNDSAV